ncbi:anthranilate phosphoribosyltransferase [Fructobacillus pseudoficulneus]|uniref:Anthranilate phosphoribosyltransferase n=1 Tax=Fructobacillus pseudoficulneus TaxID=220714 RepID=A0A3F3H1L5_9LACO|nr:anthranilate phosphoribosyltransferase [Fructobacillus pseudoficulneus]
MAGEAGAPRDIVVLNAALGLNVLDEQISLQEGVRLAQEAIDSGKAEALLDNLVAGVELAL